MADWSDGYVTNIEYTAHFYPYLAPVTQNLALLLDGVMPVDTSQPYTYCELGCGHGYTTAVLAAANPMGKFWGVDFNPTHIAGANQLASVAGLTNLTYLENSFVELAGAGLPQFDFIALHGVWSWISRSNREAIVAFIKSNLKPGGVVYISYNAMPGWAGIAPLRQLFIESQRHKSEVDFSSVDAALDLATKMRGAEAGYFKFNPVAGAMLDTLGKMPKNYLLHEYFNMAWEPSYFSEVASDLKQAKLSFACSSDVLEQVDQLCLNAVSREQLQSISDPTARQTIRDYFRNSRFRRDLFTRGARKLNAAERAIQLRSQRFVARVGEQDFPYAANFPAGGIALAAQPYAEILAQFSNGPVAFGEVSDNPAFGQLGQQGVFQAVLIMLALNWLQPVLPADQETARRESVARFNKAALARPTGAEGFTFASPVSGNGTTVPHIDQVFLNQIRSTGKTSAEDVLNLMQQQGIRLTQSGDAVHDAEQSKEGVHKAHATFLSQRLSVYRNLGLA